MRPSNFYPRPPRGGRLTVEVDDPDIFEISIHALREEGDHFPPVVFEVVLEFLSTPSARRATRRPPETQGAGADFYPRPPRGGRLPLCAGCKTAEKFLSTPSARRATLLALSSVMGTPIFLSTPSARRATCPSPREPPRAGYFYPRPPRGGRPAAMDTKIHRMLFLSTPSARRATRGGEKTMSKIEISIHALREEGDQAGRLWVFEGRTFLSTPSARRATVKDEQGRVYHKNFYPRPPRGGRQMYPSGTSKINKFLSTPSARRATFYPVWQYEILKNFYPRPPRGGRLTSTCSGRGVKKFLSTPSARRATTVHISLGKSLIFLSTPSARRATTTITDKATAAKDFYPRPPRGGRRVIVEGMKFFKAISIHALREEGDSSHSADTSPSL